MLPSRDRSHRPQGLGVRLRLLGMALIGFGALGCGEASEANSRLASRESQLTAFVFLSTECPLSENYTLPLNELRAKYTERELDLVGVFPLGDDDRERVDTFCTRFQVQFSTRLDHDYALVKALQASVTPEVVLLDGRDRTVYRGKIDNWAVKLGTTRKAATVHYLRDAVAAALAGDVPATQRVDPVGCFMPEEPYIAARE